MARPNALFAQNALRSLWTVPSPGAGREREGGVADRHHGRLECCKFWPAPGPFIWPRQMRARLATRGPAGRPAPKVIHCLEFYQIGAASVSIYSDGKSAMRDAAFSVKALALARAAAVFMEPSCGQPATRGRQNNVVYR